MTLIVEAQPQLKAAVLAVDPGVTTGLAFRFPDGLIATTTVVVPADLWYFVVRSSRVIVERFATSSQISSYGLHTVELVGGVKALCSDHMIPLVVRTPQQRTAWMGQARAELAKQNRHQGGQTSDTTYMVHECDALAHLLAWEATQL